MAGLHGNVLGAEARARAKDVIPGPGFDLTRTPLCGRNFEYLSDAFERLHGFKRLSLAPIAAEDVKVDLVGCSKGLAQVGVSRHRRTLLGPGKAQRLDGITIHTVAADHGDLSPSALRTRRRRSGRVSLRLSSVRAEDQGIAPEARRGADREGTSSSAQCARRRKESCK